MNDDDHTKSRARLSERSETGAFAAFAHALKLAIVIFVVALSVGGTAHADWTKTFEDNFDEPTVDRAKWKFSNLQSDQTLFTNNELECYTADALSQSNGILSIIATKRAIPVKDCKGAKHPLQYSSGEITTAGCLSWDHSLACRDVHPFSQAFGYFEMRAKIPAGQGLWPAFWLCPADSSWPPEIDIFEALGHQPDKLYMSYHFNDAAGQHQAIHGIASEKDYTQSFNVYGLSWLPGKLIWYVNGREVFRYTNASVTNKPMFLIVNLAVGGSWPGNPDASTQFPASMLVDYVRVYQRSDASDGERPSGLAQ